VVVDSSGRQAVNADILALNHYYPASSLTAYDDQLLTGSTVSDAADPGRLRANSAPSATSGPLARSPPRQWSIGVLTGAVARASAGGRRPPDGQRPGDLGV
jgi:hypothetical protein